MAQQPSSEGRTAEVLALKARVAEEERLCQLSREPGISRGLEAALAALAGQVWSSQPSGTNLVLKLPAEIDLAEVLCTTLPKRLVTAAALAHHPAAVLSYARALLCSYTSGDAAALGVFGELTALADAVGVPRAILHQLSGVIVRASTQGCDRWERAPPAPVLQTVVRLACAHLAATWQQAAAGAALWDGVVGPRTAVDEARSAAGLGVPLGAPIAAEGRLELRTPRALAHLLGPTLKVLQPLSTAPGTLSADQLYLCEAALVTLTYALQLLFQHLTALAVSAREAGRTSALAQELLRAAVEDREHLLESARQMALLLHAATDGGAAGIQGRRPSQDGVDGPILIHNALAALQYSTVLLLVLYEADRLRGLAPSALFAQSAEGASRVLETVELLVRFVGKRPGLGERLTAMLGPQPLAAQHTGASEVLLSLATEMMRDLLAAPAALIPAGIPAAAQRALWRVRSLTASAAKLLRCMPSIPAMETRGGGRHHWAQCVMERITELACALLVQQPGLVPDPGEQLTEHLRAVGFVGFVCIPGLLRAEQNLSAFGELHSEKHTLWSGHSYDRLLNLLRAAGLIDLAVRGGLGAVLCAYMKNCQVSTQVPTARSAEGLAARSVLTSCAEICQAASQPGGGHGTSLAIALVKDGLLRVGVEHSVWATEAGFGGRARRNRVASMHDAGIFSVGLSTLLRAVCTALDASAGSALLEAHAELLQGAPDIDADLPTEMLIGSPFMRFVTDPSVWREVRARLLPALEATCAPLVAGGGALQDGLFRETSVAAAGCSNPACTCLLGLSEAALQHRVCAACREARYCSRQCQRSDWPRHKPLCKAIQELK